MAYIIERSDPNKSSITINDGTINNQTSITLLGRNYTNYGGEVATAEVHLLENFCNQAAPLKPIQGQLWFDNGELALKINVSTTDGQGDWKTLVLPGQGGGGADLGSPDSPYNTLYVDHVGSDTHPITSLHGGTIYGSFVGDLDGTAMRARYADLAERYESDKPYDAGTVVRIGGEKEITETTHEYDEHVFGVISTHPAVMLNSDAGTDDTHPYVALVGRVPIKIFGKVCKGDRLVSSPFSGVAMAAIRGDEYTCIIGRALESSNHIDSVVTIEAVVGVK